MHDRYEDIFRHKISSVYMFEENCRFDRKRTLRIHCRKLLRKFDLEKTFEGVGIDWEQMQLYYHSTAHRLEYVYLVCHTQEIALKVLEDKHIYCLKLGISNENWF